MVMSILIYKNWVISTIETIVSIICFHCDETSMVGQLVFFFIKGRHIFEFVLSFSSNESPFNTLPRLLAPEDVRHQFVLFHQFLVNFYSISY